jgi:hypothetical protein
MELSNQLHTSAANPLYPFSSMLGGPQSQSGRFGEDKNIFPYRESILRRRGDHQTFSFTILEQYCTRPYTIDQYSTRPYTIDQYCTRPYTIDQYCTRPYTIDQYSTRPYKQFFFPKAISISFSRYTQSVPAVQRAFWRTLLYSTKSHFQLLCPVP